MRPWLQLARISNLPTVWTNVTAAWLLAGGTFRGEMLWLLILAGSLLYIGGMILNDAADVKFDREHRRERPIPSGQVSLRTAWAVGISLLIVGFIVAILAGASVVVTLSLVVAILAYDLYHKPWAGSVIIMGACRALLYCMAASAVPLAMGIPWHTNHNVLACAIALGCYIVGITLAARMEHKAGASLPAVPLVVAMLMLLLPALVCARRFVLGLGNPWQIAILVVFIALVAYAVRTMRKGGPNIGKAVGLLLAAIVVVDALAVSIISIPVALVFVCLVPVLLLWQRWVAAT